MFGPHFIAYFMIHDSGNHNWLNAMRATWKGFLYSTLHVILLTSLLTQMFFMDRARVEFDIHGLRKTYPFHSTLFL